MDLLFELISSLACATNYQQLRMNFVNEERHWRHYVINCFTLQISNSVDSQSSQLFYNHSQLRTSGVAIILLLPTGDFLTAIIFVKLYLLFKNLRRKTMLLVQTVFSFLSLYRHSAHHVLSIFLQRRKHKI